ncbi:MAG: hypothetical protein KDF65_09680, partial [Anaerolineae bacterium]|nr:hypothetical protein [Anaerolineae bacterium]
DQTLLVSTPAAIFRSTDGGDGWEQVLLRPETAGSVRLLGFAPEGPAYAWFDYDNTLYRSRDGGRRWQAAPTEGPDSAEPVAMAGGLIAPDGTLLLRPSFYPQLLRVDPQGPSRQPLTDVLPAGFGEIQTLTYTPDGTLLAGGSRGLLRSLDGGLTWQVARNAGPLDQADISHLHATETDLFVGLRAGQLFRFEGEAASWQEISVVR